MCVCVCLGISVCVCLRLCVSVCVWLHLRLDEVVVHAPFLEVLLGGLQTALVRALAVHADQLLRKLLRQQLGHLLKHNSHLNITRQKRHLKKQK